MTLNISGKTIRNYIPVINDDEVLTGIIIIFDDGTKLRIRAEMVEDTPSITIKQADT
jgi:hypothetical protein